MKFILSLFFTFILLNIFSQKDIVFNLIPEKNKIEIGEPISIKMSIKFSAEFSNNKIILPTITDSSKVGENIEIWEVNNIYDTLIETNEGNFLKQIEQEFTIATFDTGMVEIKPLKAIFNTDTIVSNAITFIINKNNISSDEKIKDIKPIEEDPYTNLEKIILWLEKHWIIIVIILITPIILFIIYKLIKQKPKKEEIKEIIPLNIRVLSKLDKIEKDKLWQNGKHKKHHSKTINVLKEYLSERYSIATFEKTSDEILEQLKYKPLDKEQLILLEKAMKLADLIKFAKTIPTPIENENVVSVTRKIINSTYKTETNKTEENQ